MNDPTSLNWDTNSIILSGELIIDESYPGGVGAVRVNMAQRGEVSAGGLNMPILARVSANDQLTIGFFACTIESSVEDGLARAQVRLQQNVSRIPASVKK